MGSYMKNHLLVVKNDFYGVSQTEKLESCSIIAFNFQTASNIGVLNNLTSDTLNGEVTICATSSSSGKCEFALFALPPNSNPDRVISEMFDLRRRASGGIFEL